MRIRVLLGGCGSGGVRRASASAHLRVHPGFTRLLRWRGNPDVIIVHHPSPMARSSQLGPSEPMASRTYLSPFLRIIQE